MTAFVFIHFEDSGNVPGVPALLALTRRHAGERALALQAALFAPHSMTKACQVIFLELGAKRMGMSGLTAV